MTTAPQPHQQQRYRVIERIAAGGMAEVFSAESAGLEGFKKKVAIKRVLPHLTEKRQFINMFLDEARLSARLGHSNCVQVFDIGKNDSAYFIVMEFVDGADLKAITESLRSKGQAIPLEEACLITVRICEGLAYAHELKDEAGKPLHIVHRDMSPPNILITNYGEVKIADFGLAKANSQLEQSQPGVIKGKFGYLSPEAAQGHEVDYRTDIFAVGIMLWEMLSGKRLFQGVTDLETVRMVQRAEVPDIRTIVPSVPESVAHVLSRALSKTPETRYQAARDLGADLNRVMFDLNRAVSSFDIAKIVSTVKAELRAAKHRTQNRITLIGSMIDEALIEFTSLDSSGGASPTRQNSVSFTSNSLVGPLPSALENVDWGNSLGLGSSASIPRPSPQASPGAELGNLLALEDERNPSRPAGGGKSQVGAFVAAAAAVLVLGLGAAYFTGLIPH
jgi:eukaryotic-like serine/threonine-protein kinase